MKLTWPGLLAGLLILTLAVPALADVAPPLQPPASSLAPGGATQVQIVAERVVIEVLPPPASGGVRVHADFAMRNQGPGDESLAVRFPLEDLSGMGDGYGQHPQVEGFAAVVNGRPVPTRTVEEPGEVDGSEPVPWAVFDVAFPAGEEVEIAVSYETRLTGYHEAELSGYDWASLSYILETGAGWHGPIGSAEIVLLLPYEAGPENVCLDEGTTPGGQFAGREVRWRWEDLEPTRQDNWRARIVWPDDWLHILELRRAVAGQPGEVAAWVDLVRAYRRVGSEKHGLVYRARLAELSQATAEEALQRHPGSAELHAELARVLWWRLLDWETINHPSDADDPAVQAVLAEAEEALRLDPTCLAALAVRREVLEWLGVTPTPQLSAAPAPVTPAPAATPVAAPEPELTAPGLPALPLALALVLALVGVTAALRWRR